MSMAAGEYVSVSSQSDTEQADLARERKELSENAEFELSELAEIYVKRGVDQPLARQVARQLMAKDALTAHALSLRKDNCHADVTNHGVYAVRRGVIASRQHTRMRARPTYRRAHARYRGMGVSPPALPSMCRLDVSPLLISATKALFAFRATHATSRATHATFDVSPHVSPYVSPLRIGC
jgi:VIT family